MASEVFVDQDICIGCGLCVSIVPEVFQLNDDGVSEVHNQAWVTEAKVQEAKVQEAIDSCPVNCIQWR